jgi:hypothetical protein
MALYSPVKRDNAGSQAGDTAKGAAELQGVVGRGQKPADETDVRYHHDSLPELQVGDLLPYSIQFRHAASSPLAKNAARG